MLGADPLESGDRDQMWGESPHESTLQVAPQRTSDVALLLEEDLIREGVMLAEDSGPRGTGSGSLLQVGLSAACEHVTVDSIVHGLDRREVGVLCSVRPACSVQPR